MSSLFDTYSDWENYPKTIFNENDKNFSQLKTGDKIYCLTGYYNDYKIEELIIIKEWYAHKGHFYIKCLRNKNKFYINFGPSNCGNVQDAINNSIILYKDEIIGTNKYSIYDYEKKTIEKEKSYYESKLKEIQDKINLLNKQINCKSYG